MGQSQEPPLRFFIDTLRPVCPISTPKLFFPRECEDSCCFFLRRLGQCLYLHQYQFEPGRVTLKASRSQCPRVQPIQFLSNELKIDLKPLCAAACSGWRRRWWSHLSVAVQRTVCSTALGGDWIAPALRAGEEPSLATILAGAEPYRAQPPVVSLTRAQLQKGARKKNRCGQHANTSPKKNIAWWLEQGLITLVHSNFLFTDTAPGQTKNPHDDALRKYFFIVSIN